MKSPHDARLEPGHAGGCPAGLPDVRLGAARSKRPAQSMFLVFDKTYPVKFSTRVVFRQRP